MHEKIDKIISISCELDKYWERIEDKIYSAYTIDEDGVEVENPDAPDIALMPRRDEIYPALKNAIVGLRNSDQTKIDEALAQVKSTLVKAFCFEGLILTSNFQTFQESWDVPISEVVPNYLEHCLFFNDYAKLLAEQSDPDIKVDIDVIKDKNLTASKILRHLDASIDELKRKTRLMEIAEENNRRNMRWQKIGILFAAIAVLLAVAALPQTQKWWDDLSFGGSAQAKSPTPQEAASSVSQARTK